MVVNEVRAEAPPDKRTSKNDIGRFHFAWTDSDAKEVQGETWEQRWHTLRETMHGLEQRLNPARFVRIHRSTIVNLHRVKELQRQFHGEYAVVLHDGTELKLSRNFRDNLASRIGRGF